LLHRHAAHPAIFRAKLLTSSSKSALITQRSPARLLTCINRALPYSRTALTAGDSTYDAGRFLDVAKPAADVHLVSDFNRAITPPCGFTPYATCPLPPRQNWLPFAMHAGELKPSGTHEQLY